jgi:hypothetical protein
VHAHHIPPRPHIVVRHMHLQETAAEGRRR